MRTAAILLAIAASASAYEVEEFDGGGIEILGAGEVRVQFDPSPHYVNVGAIDVSKLDVYRHLSVFRIYTVYRSDEYPWAWSDGHGDVLYKRARWEHARLDDFDTIDGDGFGVTPPDVEVLASSSTLRPVGDQERIVLTGLRVGQELVIDGDRYVYGG